MAHAKKFARYCCSGSIHCGTADTGSLLAGCRESDFHHTVVAGPDDNHCADHVLCVPGIREILDTDQDLPAEQYDAGNRRRDHHTVHAAIHRKRGTPHYGRHRLSGGDRHIHDADHRQGVQRDMAGGSAPPIGQAAGDLLGGADSRALADRRQFVADFMAGWIVHGLRQAYPTAGSGRAEIIASPVYHDGVCPAVPDRAKSPCAACPCVDRRVHCSDRL